MALGNREENQGRPEPTPVQPVVMEDTLRSQFEAAAVGVSTRAGLAIDDVRSAYEDKPESLTTIFESMQQEKSDMGSWIGWSVFWLIVVPPIALYTGYKAFESYNNLESVKNQVKSEVASDKSENAPARPANNGPDAAP